MRNCLILTVLILFTTSVSKIASLNDNQLVLVDEGDNESQFNRVDKIEISDDVFIPTSEWQTIKKDQGIPRGLHVRMNIQTGVKEAKLLDETEEIQVNEPKKQNFDKIRKSLEKLNDENSDDSKNINMNSEPEKVFRSYEKLKEEMKNSDINLLSDTEIIKKLISNLNSSEDKAQQLIILDDIEYYVHKLDNSLILCDIGGFNLLMTKLNTSQDLGLKTKYALVLGSAMQGSPYVKIHALESNLLQLLLNQISKSFESPEDTNIQDYIAKLVFSLSGMLRNFPIAQNKFVQYGGVETLKKVLENSNYSVKLKTKALTLITDLISERMFENFDEKDTEQQEQYFKFDLVSKLVETEWCTQFEQILLNANDNDTKEKVYDAILSIIDRCQGSLSNSVRTSLVSMKQNYLEMSKEMEETQGDDYFLGLSKKIEKILSFL